ncbi:MAG TPA: tyrosine protein phosphatase [Aestuariivirgaceae bacterium]|jgi:predicted protein tyrosine phosphatase
MIIVSPLSAVPRLVSERGVTHVLGCLGPESPHPELGLVLERHLRLTFHDILGELQGFQAPMREHMEQIVDFIDSWDQSGSLLIHCFAGISRSTASAFTAMCMLNPQEDECALAQELRSHSPVASPNTRMVKLADDILGRGGRMVEAVELIGRGAEAFEGTIFSWNVVR